MNRVQAPALTLLGDLRTDSGTRAYRGSSHRTEPHSPTQGSLSVLGVLGSWEDRAAALEGLSLG